MSTGPRIPLERADALARYLFERWQLDPRTCHAVGAARSCGTPTCAVLGKGARPSDLAWYRSLRDQCRAAGVPYFQKQLGARPYDTVTAHEFLSLRDPKGGDPSEWPEDLRVRQFPAGMNPPASAGGSRKAVRA